MAVTPQFAFGPWIAESNVYGNPEATFVSAGINPYSCGRLRVASLANKTIFSRSVANIAANNTYVWIMFWWWCPTLASGETTGIWLSDVTAGVDLRAAYNAGGFTVNLGPSLATGTTVYSIGTSSPHLFILRYNTSTKAVSVWIDHALELTATDSGSVPAFRVHNSGTSDAAGDRDWSQFIQLTGTSATDIDGTTAYPEVRFHYPDGDGDTSEYGDQTNCNSALGGFGRWDDWASFGTSDGDTTYNCGFNNNVRAEISTLTAVTYQTTILGVQHAVWLRQGATAAKAVTHSAVIRQNATSRSVAYSSTIPTTYYPELTIFDLSPDGSAWSQTIMDALQAGQSRVSMAPAGDADLVVSALAVEGIAIGPKAPPGFQIGLSPIAPSLPIPRTPIEIVGY